MSSGGPNTCRLPMRWPMTKTNSAAPVRAMMYFFPSVEFQIRENKFMGSAAQDEHGEIYRPFPRSVNVPLLGVRNCLPCLQNVVVPNAPSRHCLRLHAA